MVWDPYAATVVFGGKEHSEARTPDKGKALLWFVVVSLPQCGENTAFFSGFPLGGNHG